MNIMISFGALSPPIEEQLQDQGFTLDMDPVQRQGLQRDAMIAALRISLGELSERLQRLEEDLPAVVESEARWLETQP